MAEDLKDLSGAPLFPFEMNWATEPKLTAEPKYRDISFPGTKLISSLHISALPNELTAEISFHDKEEEKRIIDFFIDRQGKAKRFWIKCPLRNYTLHDTWYQDQTSIDIKDTGLIRVFKGFERFYFDNGDNVSTRKILSATAFPDPDFIRLTVTDPSEIEWRVDDKKVHMGRLLLVRFTHDNLDFKYQTDQVGTTTLKVMELNYEYNEV